MSDGGNCQTGVEGRFQRRERRERKGFGSRYTGTTPGNRILKQAGLALYTTIFWTPTCASARFLHRYCDGVLMNQKDCLGESPHASFQLQNTMAIRWLVEFAQIDVDLAALSCYHNGITCKYNQPITRHGCYKWRKTNRLVPMNSQRAPRQGESGGPILTHPRTREMSPGPRLPWAPQQRVPP